MTTRKNHQSSLTPHKQTEIHVEPSQTNGLYGIPLTPLRTVPGSLAFELPDLSDMKKSSITYNGLEYQLIPVEIEKDAELGLVVGQVQGEQWVFIDEILPNGMIDMHGTLKEGDYLVQAGVYSLIGIDVPIALVLIERAYDEGRKTVSFVAARQQKPDRQKMKTNTFTKKKEPVNKEDHQESKARSFIENQNNEQARNEPHHSEE